MQISVLGPFEVRTDSGTPIEVPGARLRALLIALALEAGHGVPRSTLIDWVWGDDPPSEAVNALQRLVSRLRKTLPDGSIEAHGGGYRLLVDRDAVDALRFEDLVARARGVDGPQRASLLRDALDRWRGSAAQDVDLEGSDAFDAAVTRLEVLRLAAMEDRYTAELDLGRGQELVAELTDVVAAHPDRERLVAASMRALAAAGRDTEALQVYERTRAILADTLGVDPSPELAALHVAVLRGELAPRPRERTSNVRAELTSFVGRNADLDVVRGLVAEHRLTTLIGPGGSGKTRLAVETARTLDEPPDGVWLVELAALGTDGDVALATLAALGLRDAALGGTTSAEPTERLVDALRGRDALVILDNCEHVIESAATVAHRVLGACPGLRILATSREPLGITGEALWLVEPLTVPESSASRDDIESSPAVRLLRDRAGAVRQDLGSGDDTVATLARVCRALDGMPLAIELAAARLRTMSLDQLASRLDDRFRLLTGGSRTALPRHRTLRAVIDWSWELLTDAERTVLRRLSVFSGGVRLEAAERVTVGAGVEPGQVLDLLTALAEKSLLVPGDQATPRYRMLGTIKEYAAERLAEAGEVEAAHQAHLAYVTELAETAEPHLRRAEQVEWLARLRAEHDDLAAALRTAIAAGDTRAALRLAAATGWYWWLGGRRAEGLELLMAAADLPGEATAETRALTYGFIVLFVTSGLGDEQVGARWNREAYRLSRQVEHRNPVLGFVVALERLLEGPEAAFAALEELLDSEDPWVAAMARWQLGKLPSVLGHGRAEAQAHLEGALAEFRTLGERFGTSLALTELAALYARRGEFARASQHCAQAIEVLTELGAVEDVIEFRTQQAFLSWLDGDREACEAALAEAERIAEGVTWPYALGSLALGRARIAVFDGRTEVARDQLELATDLAGDVAQQPHFRAGVHDLLGYVTDDVDEARAHRVDAWKAALESAAPPVIAQVLVGVADVAARGGDHERAARLLAASIEVRGTPDRSHPVAARLEQDVRRHLGERRFAEVTREGAEGDWRQLVEKALAP